jgi:hypothetical protein
VTILGILQRHDAVHRPMASPEEIKTIWRLSKERVRRCEIVRLFGRSYAFVVAWQCKVGCQWRRKLDEQAKNEIVAA